MAILDQLQKAIQQNEAKEVEALLPQVAPIQLIDVNDSTNCVQEACLCKDDKILRMILEKLGKDLSHFAINQGIEGFTALHRACGEGTSEAVIGVFLEYCHDSTINKHSKKNWLPIELAAKTGKAVVVKMLLDRGAKVEPDVNGYTLLHIASLPDSSSLPMFQTLLENDAIKASINHPNKKQFTALHLACRKGHTEVVRLLLENGAKESVNRAQSDGWTALHFACRKGHTEVVRLLLENGAKESVNRVLTEDGWTALHQACNFGSTEMIFLLMESGARFDTKNKDGKTPFELNFEGKEKLTIKAYIEAITHLKKPDISSALKLLAQAAQYSLDTLKMCLTRIPLENQNIPKTSLEELFSQLSKDSVVYPCVELLRNKMLAEEKEEKEQGQVQQFLKMMNLDIVSLETIKLKVDEWHKECKEDSTLQPLQGWFSGLNKTDIELSVFKPIKPRDFRDYLVVYALIKANETADQAKRNELIEGVITTITNFGHEISGFSEHLKQSKIKGILSKVLDAANREFSASLLERVSNFKS